MYDIRRITASQDLSAGALSLSHSANVSFELVAVLLHASVNITEDIAITFDSMDGANYDTVIKGHSMSTEQDFVFRPEGRCVFQHGQTDDAIVVSCTNGNATGTVYVTLLVSPING